MFNTDLYYNDYNIISIFDVHTAPCMAFNKYNTFHMITTKCFTQLFMKLVF